MNNEVDSGVEGFHMLESLIHEIDTAQQELNTLRSELSSKNLDSLPDAEKLLLQARTLKMETKALKTLPPDGLDEDKGVRYYVAVGMLEQQIKDDKDLKNITDRNIETNKQILSELNTHIANQQKLIKKMEDIVEARAVEERSEEGQALTRRKLEKDLRNTRLATKELKSFLVEFINKIGAGPDVEDGCVPMGMLLQALWTEFQQNDREGWMDIENLDFEVRDEDIQQLFKSDIIQMKNGNPKVVQLIDFTMRY